MATDRTTWKSIAPIFADVVVSPWNLFLGGLLVSQLNFWYVVIAAILGYGILAILLQTYGYLGFHHRKQTSELLEPLFGTTTTRVVLSILLAAGQIGWFAVVTQIGGTSLGYLLGIDTGYGILLYAVFMVLIAVSKIHTMGIIKFLTLASSASLFLYLIITRIDSATVMSLQNNLIINEPIILLWGISVIVSSLISFISVSPDFYSQLQTKHDTWMNTFFGLFLPGVMTVLLGALVFTDDTSLSVAAFIGVGSLAVVGHIINVLTNMDASTAIYTPGNRIRYLTNLPLPHSIFIATMIGTLFALSNILGNLEVWISVLATWFPAVITLTIMYYRAPLRMQQKTQYRTTNLILAISAILLLLFQSPFLIWIVPTIAVLIYCIMCYVSKEKTVVKE